MIPASADDGMPEIEKVEPRERNEPGYRFVACNHPVCLGRGPFTAGGYLVKPDECECALKNSPPRAAAAPSARPLP